MFIKIKAQSSDFENQYIRDRNIFKKKRKGSKVLFSTLLVAAIGGYFYYLNSGSPLQTTHPTTASAEVEDDAADILTVIKESETVNDSKSEIQNQLITNAVANDQQQEVDNEAPVVELNPEKETAENIIASEETNDAIKIDSESTESITDNNDDVIDLDEPTEELTALNSSDDIKLDDNSAQTEDITAPIIEELTNSENSESLLAQESDTSVTQPLQTNNLATETETEIAITDAGEANVQLEVVQTQNTLQDENNRETLDLTETDQIATEQLITVVEESNSNRELELTNTDKSVESLLAQDTSNTENEISFDSTEEVLIVEEIQSNDEDPILIAENPVEITDQSLAATETSTTTSSFKDIKDNPIKAISTIISNVFAKSSEEKELAADVVEIDFSAINSEKNGEQKVAIVTVTEIEETDYQGSSIEALTQSSTESINTQAIEVVKVTKFKVTENDVSEIIEKEKNDSTPFSSDNEPSIFDGVDSVSYNQVPAKVDTKKQSAENQTTIAEEETNTSKAKKEKAVVEIETIEVAKVETEKNKEKNSISATFNDATTTDLATATANTESNASKITIKDLYDQLMTNLDEKNVAKTEDIPTNKSIPEKITIKQLYQQINTNTDQGISDNSKIDTTISIADKTEIVTTDPEGKVAAVELGIDPDKSLAMVDQPDSDIKLDPVEEIISATSSIKSTSPQTPDQSLEEIEIQTASINTNPPTDSKGSTPLMIAALNSDLQTVRELVQQGAKINTRNDWGWTALLNATIKGNQELVNYLLKNGASPHLADNDGRSPLMAAVLNKHPQVVKALLNYSADVNKANRDGWTALSFAAWNGDARSAKYLLEANAFKQHLTSEGLTPLQLAEQGGHKEVIRLLNL